MSARGSKQPDFPLEVKVGSARTKIYQGENASGVYYQIVYYDGDGMRRRVTRSDLGKAKAEARRIATAIHNGSLQATPLSEHDRIAFERAAVIAKRLGGSVDTLLGELEEARSRLPGGVSMIEAADFFARHSGSEVVSKSLPEIIVEFEDHLEGIGRSGRYREDARSRLRRLADAFPGACDGITVPELQKWINNLKRKPGKGPEVEAAGEEEGGLLAARTRNNFRALIVSLFHFARDQGYLPSDLPTVADKLKKASDDGEEIGILTPKQMEGLLGAASDRLIPYLAIGAFSGLRSAEILRLDWGEVDLEENHIEVTSGKAKTSQRRLAPMPPNLAAWLKPYHRRGGGVCESKEVVTDRRNLAKNLGIEWPSNALRHSFASYRLAAIGDPKRVAYEMGNSPAVVIRNYRKVVTPRLANEWFGICPA